MRTHRRFAAAVAAAALAFALLAVPAHAAGKASKSETLLAGAWAWLYDVFCEENGWIVP